MESGELRAKLRELRYRYGLMANPKAPARQAERSMIFSADDEARPSDRLLDVALAAAAAAREIPLTDLGARLDSEPRWPEVWPGEHYRLLAGLVQVMKPKVALEIGTATGMSALALAAAMEGDGRVATFDIVPWRDYPGTVLREDDFTDGRLVQHVDDISRPEGLARHRELVQKAELIFIDAAKDGEQEQRFIDAFDSLAFERPPIVVFDDIRQWKMLGIWRRVRRPKLDLTSFGHWSGTGLVDWA